MIHPDTELRLISKEMGFGIFATKPIPKGTVIWIQDAFDIVLTPDAVDRLPPLLKRIVDVYAYGQPNGNMVVAWDYGRYMNHSCEPSTVSVGSLCDIAAKDIKAGDELTGDYATMNLDHLTKCGCGAKTCRGAIKAADLKQIGPRIDSMAREAVALAKTVPQVLFDVANDADRKRVMAIASGKEACPSCMENLPPGVV